VAGGLGMQPIEHFCCQNPACPDQGHRGKGNLAEAGRRQPRTPAMAAGLADHVWTLQEWLTYPAMPC
jgi:hypothetical protein